MIIKETNLKEPILAWAGFLGVFIVVYGLTLFMGRFVNASWDIHLLLLLNPDAYIPILDEWVILETDFGGYFIGIMLISWQIGYYCCRTRPAAQERARKIFYGLGVVFALWHVCGLFIQKKGIFWWSEYEYPIVFVPLAIAFLAGFSLAGNLFVWLEEEDQHKLAHAFWLTLLALFFVNIIGEDSIKALVERHRPLHSTYEAWNGQIRILPDEVVRGSYSYISGHTSSFFAQIMIYFWLFKSLRVRCFLMGWACFHGFTRIYTAAHFPYCVLMAVIFAVVTTSAVYYFLWNHKFLPLISMTALFGSLFLHAKSPVLPVTLLAIVWIWFAVYWFRSRDDLHPYLPMDDGIEL